jgi:hypothetical protein
MNFLTNDICEFEILSNHNLIKKGVNVIVSVFFKRDQYYKNFAIYVKGLQKALRFIDDPIRNNPQTDGFIYILFIDSNVYEDKEIMGYINKCKNCVPVLFRCVEYMSGSFHYDLFGTLVRFFPVFNFPNNPCGMVISIDVDLHDEDYVRLESIVKHKMIDITGAGSIVGYIYTNLTPYIFANLVSYNCEKFDRSIIMNFIRNADKYESKGYYGKRLTTFGFGVDEIFLNDILLTHAGKVNVIIDYQICYFFFHSTPHMLDEKRIESTSKILDIIIGDIIPDEDKKEMTAEQKIFIIDKTTYRKRDKTKTNDDMTRRLTMVIDNLVKNNKIWMEKEVQQFMYDYLRHIISATLVIQYNHSENAVVSVDAYDTVYDSDHEIDSGKIDNLERNKINR